MASKPAKKATAAPSAQSPQPVRVYSQINTLLYTLRAIAEREDQLCSLQHHLQSTGKLTPALNAELHGILDDIPTAEYVHDVDTLRASLNALGTPGEPKTATPRAKAGSRRKVA